MMRLLMGAGRRTARVVETPTPDRMCAAYAVLMERLFDVLPHEHTRLEVQQMLYAAQVLSIARNGRPLFDNQFVATSKGPVILVLWRLQSSPHGLGQVMHPVHRDLLDQEDRDVVESVADRLARLDARQIAVYANSPLSAAGRIFVQWSSENVKSLKKGPDGFLGDRSIALADLESEVRRRYAGRNALERAEQEAAQKDSSDAAMARAA
jgi:uncharacterized phage-associated protein